MSSTKPEVSNMTLRWSSLRSELFWIYDGPVMGEALHQPADHQHGYWLWLIRKGRVIVEMSGERWEARAGQWLVSPHGRLMQDFSEDADILSVHFRCQWPTGENLFLESSALVFDSSDFPQLERSASRLEKLVYRHFPGVRLEFLRQATEYPVFLKVQQRFLQWLIDFYEAMTALDRTLYRGGQGDERLWRAAELLHAISLDSPFPAQELQRETSLGRAQLDRLFLKEFGATSRDYWENLRQQSAVRSLQSSTMSIKEIGYRLGFKQPSHFTKWFTRRIGATPQNYRAQSAREPQFVEDGLGR